MIMQLRSVLVVAILLGITVLSEGFQIGSRRQTASSRPGCFFTAASSSSSSLLTEEAESASTNGGADVASTATGGATTQFTTEPMQVYIEDTDAYGIMYNANYVRAYDRALHRTSFAHDHASAVLQHDGWSLAAIEQMKYKVPPPLGGTYVVSGTLVDSPNINNKTVEEVWDLTMKSPDGTPVYSTATGARIALPPNDPARRQQQQRQRRWLSEPAFALLAPSGDDRNTVRVDAFATYRDEFDPHLTTHLPLTKLLHLFERARSNWLGGPAVLRQLQEEGVLYVLTDVKDCCLVDHAKEKMIPGEVVTVYSHVTIKRRGMVVTFQQSAAVEDAVIGQAIITMMAIDSVKRRPTSNIPAWLREKWE